MSDVPMIRAALRYKGAVPYGGWYNIDRPDLGMVGGGTNFEMLMNNLRKYRRANGIPIGLGFEEEVEREVCKLYSAECIETSNLIPNRNRSFSFEDVTNGTQAMIRFKLAGSPTVSQEEANRRAAICAKCDNNIQFSKPCAGICGLLGDIAQAIVGSKETPSDVALNSCAVCGCYLKAAIWVDLETQRAGLTEEQRQQFEMAKQQYGCWKAGDSS